MARTNSCLVCVCFVLPVETRQKGIIPHNETWRNEQTGQGTMVKKFYQARNFKILKIIEVYKMTNLSKTRAVVFLVTALICSSLLVTQVFTLSLEEVVSRRQSVRSFSSENVSRQQLMNTLNFAYGYTNEKRNTPTIGTAHSLIIYTLNQTGSYRYYPETNSLVVHDLTVNKETIRHFNSDWPSDAKEVLVIVWDQTRMSNQYFAAAEAGCVAQNLHLASISQGLGTCVVGSINSEGIRNALQLENTLTPLLVMPLSYPEAQYPAACAKYGDDEMSLNDLQLKLRQMKTWRADLALAISSPAESHAILRLKNLQEAIDVLELAIKDYPPEGTSLREGS